MTKNAPISKSDIVDTMKKTSEINETAFNQWRISRRKMRIGAKVEMRSIRNDGSSSYGDSKTSGKDVMMMLDGQSSSSGQRSHEKFGMLH